ncbi:hypothetical protein [Kineococcus terrestris]|uniref:hypothetical protein n=1 Tax=Kineococcus terrestris TaxID=2044856 RepID=UPI0034DABE2E
MNAAQVFPRVAVPALLLLAGAVLLRTPAAHEVDGVVTSASAGAVCVEFAAGAGTCFDTEHIAHLRLAGTTAGTCVRGTYAGSAVRAEAFDVLAPVVCGDAARA